MSIKNRLNRREKQIYTMEPYWIIDNGVAKRWFFKTMRPATK